MTESRESPIYDYVPPRLYMVHGPAAVATLPDGTMISWQVIAGDQSSQAVAFVRREGDEVWLSPGNGWEPEPISIIDDYPVTVLWMGPTAPAGIEPFPPLELPELPELPEPPQFLSAAGVVRNDRVDALNAAVWLTGMQFSRDDDVESTVLPIAEAFEAWLGRTDGDVAVDELLESVKSGVLLTTCCCTSKLLIGQSSCAKCRKGKHTDCLEPRREASL